MLTFCYLLQFYWHFHQIHNLVAKIVYEFHHLPLEFWFSYLTHFTFKRVYIHELIFLFLISLHHLNIIMVRYTAQFSRHGNKITLSQVSACHNCWTCWKYNYVAPLHQVASHLSTWSYIIPCRFWSAVPVSCKCIFQNYKNPQYMSSANESTELCFYDNLASKANHCPLHDVRMSERKCWNLNKD